MIPSRLPSPTKFHFRLAKKWWRITRDFSAGKCDLVLRYHFSRIFIRSSRKRLKSNLTALAFLSLQFYILTCELKSSLFYAFTFLFISRPFLLLWRHFDFIANKLREIFPWRCLRLKFSTLMINIHEMIHVKHVNRDRGEKEKHKSKMWVKSIWDEI